MAAVAAAPPPATVKAAVGDPQQQDEQLLARELRRKEKLKDQIARQQARIQELEGNAGDAPDSREAAAAAATATATAELLRRRLEAETARRDEELRQLQVQHTEDDEAAREALTKVAVSLEAAKIENASLRRALSQEQQEAMDRRSEIERLRASLAEAAAAATESERAWHEWADGRDGANRLRELRDTNIRLQEKLASAESRLEGLRADCQAAAALAEARGEVAARLREQLAACVARADALKAAQAAPTAAAASGDSAPISATSPKPPQQWPRASERQLAAIRDQLDRAEATGRSRQAALQAAAAAAAAAAAESRTPTPPGSPPPLPPSPPPLPQSPPRANGAGDSEEAEVEAEATSRRMAASAAAQAELREALARAHEANADLRAQVAALRGRRPGEASTAESEGGGGDKRGDAMTWPRAELQPRRVGNGSHLAVIGGSCERSGLWRTSYCTDDLDGLRRACLSLAAERDRLAGDCRHYRRLYEEEQRLRRRLAEEARRLNGGADGRARALIMMHADPAEDSKLLAGTPATYTGDLEAASFSTYLRHRYTLK